MAFATQYNFRKVREGITFGTRNTEESLTNQADAHDCDINIIMRKYTTTGQLPRVKSEEAQYGDFSQVQDYRQCLETVRAANEQFMALPSAVRKRFANSPENFLQFVADPANQEEAEKLGLTEPKKSPYSTDAQGIISALRETGGKNGDMGQDIPAGTENAAGKTKKGKATRQEE